MRRWGAGALRRWGLLVVIATVGGARPIVAQGAAGPRPITDSTAPPPQRPSVPPFVRTGKWIALGSAFVLGYRANSLHQDANDSFQALHERCFSVPLSCELSPNGRYADPLSERLYAETRDSDRQAARYLVGAEVSFALAAAGFVWELLEREERTPNIPFEPRVETTPRESKLGVVVRF